ncbi:NAD(P)-dependent oxidoreductase [Desulfovibrio mangrovi]|uniref:SDR family oxidoreductase n=1 Tax=Desulfovibrio mangrovi TaxID=2976983 RepID=UPI0022459407|nr:NAD(P)-dependent oxidoreductase [Desulfovibrio mangrovi]UZP66739.1 NAD(P)-dependent oxidoreductase [Desulfovibrio mangrovi]
MHEKSLLITGGNGMLAGRLAINFAEAGWDVHPLGHSELDITNEHEVFECIRALRPTAVVNTAAMLVEACEAEPKEAFRVNAWGVRNLARACDRLGTQLVQISTSGLFGDEVRPYDEFTPVVNKTRYAASKYAGECFAREWCEKYIIMRLGWLYGGGLDGRRDFVTARLSEAREAGTLPSAGDKFGCPTNADDVAHVMRSLLDEHVYGLFHCANTTDEPCARADYVSAICTLAGLDATVKRTDSSGFPRSASVPDCEWIVSYALEYAGIAPMPHWHESLERYMARLPR